MKEVNKWYTLEKANGIWTVWLNKYNEQETHGGYGCSKIFSSNEKKECLEYCKEKKIKIENKR